MGARVDAPPFVGFGFGPIMAGLFLPEARKGGAFGVLAVSEVDRSVVDAVRANGGRYALNVARRGRIEVLHVDGVELLDPTREDDAARLGRLLARAPEAATALPSVRLFREARPPVAEFVALAVEAKARDRALPALIVHTAENDTRAARLLAAATDERLSPSARATHDSRPLFQCLDTVIGKMSCVVPLQGGEDLAPIAPGLSKAFLVEAFNDILVSRVTLPGASSSLASFREVDDLRPFEEAKLHGHNAAHMVLGLLCHRAGLSTIDQAREYPALLEEARAALVDECGAGLLARHAGADPLFTPEGWRRHAEDLLERMTEPALRDSVARVVRDIPRKLAWDDRLVGALRHAVDAGAEPTRLRRAIRQACEIEHGEPVPEDALLALWQPSSPDPAEARGVIEFLRAGD